MEMPRNSKVIIIKTPRGTAPYSVASLLSLVPDVLKENIETIKCIVTSTLISDIIKNKELNTIKFTYLSKRSDIGNSIIGISDNELFLITNDDEIIIKVNFNWLFQMYKNLKELDLTHVNFKGKDLSNLFYYLEKLEKIKLDPSFGRDAEIFDNMFLGDKSLEAVIFPNNTFKSAKSALSMFKNCINLKSIRIMGRPSDRYVLGTDMIKNCDNLDDDSLDSLYEQFNIN